MIIKVQSILFPYVRQIEIKKKPVVTRSERVMADRVMLVLLVGITIIASIVFS